MSKTALQNVGRIKEVGKKYRQQQTGLIKKLNEATAQDAQEICEGVSAAIVDPWTQYVNPWKGSRPPYCTKDLESFQMRRTKTYRAWHMRG